MHKQIHINMGGCAFFFFSLLTFDKEKKGELKDNECRGIKEKLEKRKKVAFGEGKESSCIEQH